ncbi:MAG: ABC transporter permease [Bryobacterales bacterium]
MSSLDRKLWRDLWGMKGQALAIAMVISSGVATFVMSLSTLHSLKLTQAVFYRDYHFADVFASLKRAPESLRESIREIPGVQQVETRIAAAANLDLPDYPDPATGRLVSTGQFGEALLNQLYLREGRLVDPAHDDEVIVSEAFAEAHGYRPGDEIAAILNGRRKELTIVGIALAPEFIYQIRPGDMFPDFAGYGILWMAHEPLANAFDMDGAFNDVAITLAANASAEDVILRLDELLARYGGLGAYARKDQVSHRYLSEEFKQLEQMATMFPTIFLGVAAFLLNVVVSRLVRTQREEIATLKAFGYSNLDITEHFAKLIIVIVLFGVAAGTLLGVWFGQGLSSLYSDFYKFPFLHYDLQPRVPVLAALISIGAALLGTLYAVMQAARQPPAEAMRPEPPAAYRVSVVEKLGLKSWLSSPTRMIVRNLERRPVKSLLTSVGIAFSCAILMVGTFSSDAVDYMMNVQFGLAQRDDISVTFVEPTSYRAFYDLLSLPGVEYGEVFRAVPTRLRFEHREYRTSIQGFDADADLMKLLDENLNPIELPPDGLLLTDQLAVLLGAKPGDVLTIEVLEGARPVHQVQLAAVVKEFIGVSAYMRRDALNRLMREGDAISGAFLSADARYQEAIYEELEGMPRIAGTVVRKKAMQSFEDTMAQTVLTFAFFNTLLAGSIAFGVVYNSARIALSERSRELASLRVLGFTRGEVSYILLGELAVLTVIAVPLGFLVGYALCFSMSEGLQTDLFRIPLILDTSTYSFSAAVVLVASAISGLIVRRKVDHLDLVAVLKTRE